MIDEKRFRELLAEGGADSKMIEEICTRTGVIPLEDLIAFTFDSEQDVIDAVQDYLKGDW
jgi:hypothetical protein